MRGDRHLAPPCGSRSRSRTVGHPSHTCAVSMSDHPGNPADGAGVDAPASPFDASSDTENGEASDALERDPRIGLILAGWRLDICLGENEHAAVYAASNQDGERAAVKVMRHELRGDEALRRRIFREANNARAVDHPAVVRVLANDVTHAGEPFIVMERVLGRSLDQLIALLEGPLDESAALLIVLDVLDTLEQCHGAGMVYRNLRPRNVSLTSDGNIKLYDFGIAWRADDPGPQALRPLAAELHGGIAPELLAHERAVGDPRSDIWSVGAMLLTLVTGARIAESTDAAAWTPTPAAPPLPNPSEVSYAAMPVDPRRLRPEVSPQVAQLILNATALDPSARYPNVAAMRNDVLDILGDRGNPAARDAGERAQRLAAVLARFYSSRDDLEREETGAWRSAEVLRNLFRLVENVLYSARRHGWDHGETEIRLAFLVERLLAAVADDPDGIFWVVRPYSFEYRAEAFWRPDAPFDRITYNLFDSGFRKMHILPGLDDTEARRFLRWLTLDPDRDLAFEDDMATTYWSREFEHIRCELVSAVVLQDVEDYEQLDRELSSMRATAIDHLRSSVQGRLSGSHVAVRDEDGADRTADYVVSRGPLLALNREVKSALSDTLYHRVPLWRGRLADLLARAIPNALHVGDIDAVLLPYDAFVHSAFEERTLPDALELFGALSEQFDDARVLARLARPFVDDGRFAQLMRTFIPAEYRLVYGDELPFLADRLARLLAHVSPEHMSTVVESLGNAHDRTILSVLLEYANRHVVGHQEELGSLLEHAQPLLGSNLIAILTDHLSADTVGALEHAFRSPHPKVRVEAAEVLARYSPRRAYRELRSLIRHEEPVIRQRAVEAVGRNKLTLAADDLFERLNERGFHQLPINERRALMRTACQVAPDKGEDVLSGLVASHGLVANEDLDISRLTAVDILKDVALTDRAIAALDSASKKRWWNSDELREAAAGAKQQVARRLANLDRELRSRRRETDG